MKQSKFTLRDKLLVLGAAATWNDSPGTHYMRKPMMHVTWVDRKMIWSGKSPLLPDDLTPEPTAAQCLQYG